jgi:hypothetical protein
MPQFMEENEYAQYDNKGNDIVQNKSHLLTLCENIFLTQRIPRPSA